MVQSFMYSFIHTLFKTLLIDTYTEPAVFWVLGEKVDKTLLSSWNRVF